jgi:hypothetical protein
MHAADIFLYLSWAGIEEFLKAHPAVALLLLSSLFVLSAYQDITDERKTGAFLWMFWAAFISLGSCLSTLFLRMWVSSLASLLLLAGEVWLIRRWFQGSIRPTGGFSIFSQRNAWGRRRDRGQSDEGYKSVRK